ncbi:hypothetical protein CLV90_0857 [Maribacter spongiicola]|uniref:Uncharacterized protein n=1 Tax=Maribacter spongiicola TaxID=1206753 RepID=A0A4R7K8P7_9FLAO|nr:hypothetical protein CLV90_0857 [Maribacter spongiicola]
MNLLKINSIDRKWWEIILWWELRRIAYNIIMYFIGLLSFYICFVTIPLVYLVIGLVLNIIYTIGWIVELIGRRNWKFESKLKYPKYAFNGYLVFSVITVFGFSIFLLLR